MTLQLQEGRLYTTRNGGYVVLITKRDTDTYYGMVNSPITGKAHLLEWLSSGKLKHLSDRDNALDLVSEWTPTVSMWGTPVPPARVTSSILYRGTSDPHTGVGTPPDCDHKWVETPGLLRMYRDCSRCHAKWEDTHMGGHTSSHHTTGDTQ